MNIAAIRKQKIAVVGSGISGLSCAWHLHPTHDVTLFEKDDRLGGHSNTVTVSVEDQVVDVDTGFIVFNPVNYPNLVKFFEALDISTCPTDMSFAVSARNGKLEYSGTGLGGLLAQPGNLLRPAFWRMTQDILRFYRESDALMVRPDLAQLTLGELLSEQGYSRAFIYDHLLPMGAAIWSTPVDKMLNYPALNFLRFCRNHGLIQLKNRPQWRTVEGGSKRYVDKIAACLGDAVRLNSRIHRIRREDDHVVIEDLHGRQEHFDQVVLACHADQSLKLLEDPTPEEQALLSAFPYQRNRAYLHRDPRLMPRRQRVWSSWNYLSSGQGKEQAVSVSYWMNRLQPLNTQQPLFVSLNPLQEPAPGTILRTFFYDHPEFGAQSYAAQQSLWSLQGKQRTWFCGAYFGYGFHEDGLQSGLAVAEQLGGLPRPWQLEQPNSRIHVHPADREASLYV